MSEAATPAQIFDPAMFRRALGQFPTGVTIVTAGHGGQLVGMTANSFSSVSLDPPLVLWSPARKAASHDVFYAAESFAVHLLGAGHEDLAKRFATGGADKFDGLTYRIGLGGAPILDEIEPVFECSIWARYPGGDHTIMVGEVKELVVSLQDPLLFHSGVMRPIETA